MHIIRSHLTLIVWCITLSKDDTIAWWCRKVWLLFWFYALKASISEVNIVDEFVYNSQEKKRNVDALELFKRAFEGGEFCLSRKNRENSRKSNPYNYVALFSIYWYERAWILKYYN